MSAGDHYDIIIIGTGAGGGTLARRLAPSGLKILMIERGEFLPRERENWDPRQVFGEQRYLARETWYDDAGAAFRPYTHYCVGGNTKMYGAALLRLREDDFQEVRHYGGVSPAWPIGYDELEPYYTQAEGLYHVHGERGSDPFEPRASGPYAGPALAHEPPMQELFDDLRAEGARPFPVPIGVRLGLGAAPVKLGLFDGYPDPTQTKADAHVVGVEPALGHSNVSLLTGALVERLETDHSGGMVSRVVVQRGGERMALRGDVVIVACGAINSAALLLRSASEKHPGGLANGSGLVGRNYMTHHNGVFIQVREDENPSTFQKTFGLTEFYRGSEDSALPLGTIQLMGKPDAGTIAWARGEKLAGLPVQEIQARTVDFFLTAEDLPSPENRITLRPNGAVQIRYRPNNLEAYERLERRLMELLDAVDRRRGRRKSTYLTARLGVSGVSHQNGTLRFGHDPRASVLDVQCRAHEVDNLYVVDGSFFPASGAVNPSLTIMANALRVGDHLMERLGAGRRGEAGAVRLRGLGSLQLVSSDREGPTVGS